VKIDNEKLRIENDQLKKKSLKKKGVKIKILLNVVKQ